MKYAQWVALDNPLSIIAVLVQTQVTTCPDNDCQPTRPVINAIQNGITVPMPFARLSNHPILPAQFVTLAEKVGLKKVPGKIQFLSSKMIEDMLIKYGHLWCAGLWFGPGHIIVLTGITGDTVQFNDPDRGVKKSQSTTWFNLKLAINPDGCLAYKKPVRMLIKKPFITNCNKHKQAFKIQQEFRADPGYMTALLSIHPQ